MSKDFLYIAEGRLFSHKDGGEREIPSAVVEGYKQRLSDSIKRNEWKTNGSGAAFMGGRIPGQDANTQLANVSSAVYSVARDGDELIYSVDVSGQSGIYRTDYDGRDCGIVQSSGTQNYSDFDYYGGKIAYTAAFGGQSHIGTRTVGGHNDSQIYTDGDTLDFHPAFSRRDCGKIYFCSSGLRISGQNEENEGPKSITDTYKQIITSTAAVGRGPASLCLLDTERGTLDTIFEDSQYDFLHPQSTRDGFLWYIRRPFVENSGVTNPFGCLLDILLLPVRIIKAFFGFFSVFSMKYSGEPLDRSVKKQDEKKMFIDGNLIDAQKAMKENAEKGEENPGIIPKSWELHRLSPDGCDTVIRRGVVAFRVYDDGSLLFSNGSAVIEGTFEGGKLSEKKVNSAKKVTFIQ